MIRFILNDAEVSTSLPPGTVVLDYIRYHQQLKGTKIGCREGDCGACTVLIGTLIDGQVRYRTATSCLTALGNIRHAHVVTIEGLNLHKKLNRVQQAMCENSATQCGFCTPGFVVSMAGYCLQADEPSYEKAVQSVDGNICRCTGYKSIQRALGEVNELMCLKTPHEDNTEFCIEQSILPGYFREIKSRLHTLNSTLNGQEQSNHPIARILGGGTDLYVQQHEAMVDAEISFMTAIAASPPVYQQNNTCFITGAATITDLMESELITSALPQFRKFSSLISSTPIRNIATVAGNFVNASPIGDLTIIFLALGAQLNLRDGENRRTVDLDRFYLAYKTLDKTAAEYIETISFELPAIDCFFNFEKVSKRTNLDIASANTAVFLKVTDGICVSARLSAGGVGPTPLLLKGACGMLEGKALSDIDLEDLINEIDEEISPISDVRGTAAYKRLLLGNLVKAHFLNVLSSPFRAAT